MIRRGNNMAAPTIIPSGFPSLKSPRIKRVDPQAGQGMPVIVLKKQVKANPVHRYIKPALQESRMIK